MKKLILIALILSPLAHSELKLKPGLWKVLNEVKDGDRKFNPMDQMAKLMATLPPDQQAKMKEMMAQMGNQVNLNTDGTIEVCYTKEMLGNKANLANQAGNNCKSNIIKETDTSFVMEVECENGKGTIEMSVKDENNFSSIVNMTREGKKIQMFNVGKFAKDDCGNIQPLNNVKK
jgi:hypothetical protein